MNEKRILYCGVIIFTETFSSQLLMCNLLFSSYVDRDRFDFSSIFNRNTWVSFMSYSENLLSFIQ